MLSRPFLTSRVETALIYNAVKWAFTPPIYLWNLSPDIFYLKQKG